MTKTTKGSDSAESRFANAVNELNQLESEGYDVHGIGSLSLSATAKVVVGAKAPEVEVKTGVQIKETVLPAGKNEGKDA